MAEKKDKTEFDYVIPLRRGWKRVPRYKRANKAIKTIKEFVVRHMKIRDRDLKKIKLDHYLNEVIWARGIKKPPIKVKVKVKKKGDIVHVELVDLPDKLKFRKAREEKIEKAAQAAIQKKKTLMEKAKEGIQQKPEETPEEVEEKKEEEKEKKAAVVEEGAKIEKQKAKQAKHQVSAKSKQPKRQQRKALAK